MGRSGQRGRRSDADGSHSCVALILAITAAIVSVGATGCGSGNGQAGSALSSAISSASSGAHRYRSRVVRHSPDHHLSARDVIAACDDHLATGHGHDHLATGHDHLAAGHDHLAAGDHHFAAGHGHNHPAARKHDGERDDFADNAPTRLTPRAASRGGYTRWQAHWSWLWSRVSPGCFGAGGRIRRCPSP